MFSPLWAIVIHVYSLYDERYIKSALFFKTLEGFVEAGPQFALQLSLLIKVVYILVSRSFYCIEKHYLEVADTVELQRNSTNCQEI